MNKKRITASVIYFSLMMLLVSLLALPAGTPIAHGETRLPVLVGFYSSEELYNSVGELDALQQYFGKPTISIAGTFLDFESPDWLITAELNAAWDHGYVPFVNLGAGTVDIKWTSEQIANGELDFAIHHWAQVFKGWSDEGKRAFIAPLQEMNGGWVSYGGDPPNYIRAFLRIRQIFKEEGVPSNSVSWVFAPNGWNDPQNGYPFEDYYPGNSVVDVVGFSSFNFGSCWTYTHSRSFEEIYEPYLDRMSEMAPGKPIFVAEIGSVPDGLDRAEWFRDTLTKIGMYPGVRGIIYFNRVETNFLNPPICNPVDYRLDASDGGGELGEGKEAFRAVVTSPPYGYWSRDSEEMLSIAFAHSTATFEDVWNATEFSGKDNTPYYFTWVERLASAHLTSGCSSKTVEFGSGVPSFVYHYYCPGNSVTRGQMAVFLEKGMHYPESFSPPSMVPTFLDDGGHWAKDWIETLRKDGITAGFPDGTYRPNSPVTRAQMAVFLLKARHGAEYQPPSAKGGKFSDVPPGYWAAPWIEELALEGITAGYPDGTYKPDKAVTRAEMAVFLVKTFDLP